MKTALIERYPTFGGTCLNVGCIPSKALLDSSEHYWNAQKHFAVHGIELGALHLNWGGMLKRKEEVVSQTCSGVEYLMKKNGIEVFQGHGSFIDRQNLSIQGPDGSKLSLRSSKVILATGSKPASLPGVEIDRDRVISSTEALKLREIPNRLIVIGGGIIGLELGSVFSRLGSEILVVEYLDRLIPSMDGTVAKEMMRCLKKQGLQFHLGQIRHELADKHRDKELFESALESYKEALNFYTIEDFPWEWALLQIRIGNVLYRLDTIKNDTEVLKQAVTAYQSSLKAVSYTHLTLPTILLV